MTSQRLYTAVLVLSVATRLSAGCRLGPYERDQIISIITMNKDTPGFQWTFRTTQAGDVYAVEFRRAGALTFVRGAKAKVFWIIGRSKPWNDAVDIGQCCESGTDDWPRRARDYLRARQIRTSPGSDTTPTCEVTLVITREDQTSNVPSQAAVRETLRWLGRRVMELGWDPRLIESVGIGDYRKFAKAGAGVFSSRQSAVGRRCFEVLGDFRSRISVTDVFIPLSSVQVEECDGLLSRGRLHWLPLNSHWFEAQR